MKLIKKNRKRNEKGIEHFLIAERRNKLSPKNIDICQTQPTSDDASIFELSYSERFDINWCLCFNSKIPNNIWSDISFISIIRLFDCILTLPKLLRNECSSR